MPPSPQLSKLRAATIDGRLINPIYRQAQLKNLYDALTREANRIEAAIAQDSSSNNSSPRRPVDVKLEVRLALRLLAETATSIAPEQALKDEYAIARGQDMPHGRQPHGVVVIEEPARHAFFYGLVAALSPAIAEGNTVVVQMKGNSLLQTPGAVFEIISAALDKDIFAVVHDELTAEDIGHRHLRVVQNGDGSSSSSNGNTISTTPTLYSNSQLRTVAIVERDADITAAADALVAARFGLLGGKSPYAPDLVLVNEWVKRDLIIALSASSARFMADANSTSASSGKNKAQSGPKRSGSGAIAEAVQEDGSANIISSNPDATIVEVAGRDSGLLSSKVDEACLLLHAVTSMDDAIDTAARHGSLAATYVFTKPDAAKYIGQFVDTSLVFVNHIPLQILFGPIAPSGHPLNFPSSSTSNTTSSEGSGPYTRQSFALPKQQFTLASGTATTAANPLTRLLAQIMLNPNASLAAAATATTSTSSLLDPKPLPEVKRLKNRLALGFFEQGIVTGGVLLLSVVLSCTGMLGWFAFKTARARLF